MKIQKCRSLVFIFTIALFAFSVQAQDVNKKKEKKETKQTIKVMKNGEVILDTLISSKDLGKEGVYKVIKRATDFDIVTLDADDFKDGKVHKKGNEVHVMVHADGEHFDVKKSEEIEVSVDGDLILIETKDGKKRKVKIKEPKMEHNGEVTKSIIVRKYDDKEEIIEILVDDEDVDVDMEGSYVFVSTADKSNKEENVFVVKKDAKTIWISEDGEHLHQHRSKDAKGNVSFYSTGKKGSEVSLKQLKGKMYRLEVNTESVEPIEIEVLNEDGDRLYKKKVGEYYGRFLKEIELEDNEKASYTVKIVQGEKEIIGEFEFK